MASLFKTDLTPDPSMIAIARSERGSVRRIRREELDQPPLRTRRNWADLMQRGSNQAAGSKDEE
jgi:hypothetical protein